MEEVNLYSFKIKKDLSLQKLVAHIYFFFNSLGLTGGLLYTNLLSPILFIWLAKKKQLKYLKFIFIGLVIYSVPHVLIGVELKSFVISNLLFLSTFIFVFSCYYYINSYQSIYIVLKQILILNTLLVFVAIPFYFAESHLQKLFWYTNQFTTQLNFTRLSLFTFEASYYALLIVPLFFYYTIKHIKKQQILKGKYEIFMVILPLILSMSFGVLGGILITVCLFCWFFRDKIKRNRNIVLILSGGLIFILVFVVFYCFLFPDSLITLRLNNIFFGIDTSTKGRTTESFIIGWKVAELKSVWFGCGLGQVKHLMPQIVKTFFPHWGVLHITRIPNATAETLAIFGVTGLLVRFGLIIYLFFKTKVYANYYRLALFTFIFIYQFTGSYITNIVEYVIWTIAFSSAFPEFNIQKKNSCW